MHTNYKIELDHFSVWAICVHRCTINTLQKILILYSSKGNRFQIEHFDSDFEVCSIIVNYPLESKRVGSSLLTFCMEIVYNKIVKHQTD